jgi:hypothetical protein
MMRDWHRLLKQYSEDVGHPEVSGFELLELLSTRSALVQAEPRLSPAQRRRLEAADARLVAAAPIIVARLGEIAPLAKLRRQANVPPSHWWWYLEVLQPTVRPLVSA